MPARKKRGTTAKKASKSPYRRELGSLISFLLCIFYFLALFGVKAPVINFFAYCAKSLIGYGFYILPFALLIMAVLLLFHRGRPVSLRVAALLVTPFFIGALVHIFSSKAEYPAGWAFFGAMASSGRDMTGGGLVSGILAHGLSAAVSRVGAAIVLIILFLVLLMIVFQYSIVKLYDAFRTRQRPVYEPTHAPMPAPKLRVQAEKQENKFSISEETVQKKKRKDFDIPLFLDPPEEKPPVPFPEKPENIKTPAEVLTEKPAPMLLPQIFTFDKTEYISPETGEIITTETKEEPPVPAPPPVYKRADPPVYIFPPLELLTGPKAAREINNSEELRVGALRLIEVLESFGLHAKVINITRGPTVTRYELELESGLKLAKLTSLSDDIALAMGTEKVNISPVLNKMSIVGVEIPNKVTTTVTLREVLESNEYLSATSGTSFAIGRDIEGKNVVGDIAKMPHLLIAGTSGAGKSILVNSLIVSLLYKASPDDVRLILIDPKKVEFPPFNGIPHLFLPVITDTEKAANTLEWAVLEMEKRYATLSECGKRDIEGYNEAYGKDDSEHPYMGRIVIIIDEMADLIMESKKEKNMEHLIVRIAQKARACGIHLVLATQRPDSKVITGLIKANVPSRIALRVSDAINSRIILDQSGAERLLGRGDMLYAPVGASKATRVQGCYVHERDVSAVVEHIKKTYQPAYSEEALDAIDSRKNADNSDKRFGGNGDDIDEMLPAAIEAIIDSEQGSVTFIQRRLKLGYARAARLMDMMEERGIVGPFEGSKPRKVLITREQWENMKNE